MQVKNILFTDSAVKEDLQILKAKFKYGWHSYRLTNKGRYAIVKGWGSHNIAILLKSEPYANFGFKFKDKGEHGVGDSINVDSLKLFVKEDIKEIYIIFRDGKLYHIPFIDFLTHSHKWQQKEGTWVRSISIHRYKIIL